MHEFPRVTFYPWVGEQYGRASRFGIRLSLLGESHYDDDPESSDCDFTQEVVQEWGQRRRAKFFTVIAKVLHGSADWIDDDARSEIWEHVAFYNFAQSVVPWAANTSHVSPVVRSADSIRDGATGFETRRCSDPWLAAVGPRSTATRERCFRGNCASIEQSAPL